MSKDPQHESSDSFGSDIPSSQSLSIPTNEVSMQVLVVGCSSFKGTVEDVFYNFTKFGLLFPLDKSANDETKNSRQVGYNFKIFRIDDGEIYKKYHSLSFPFLASAKFSVTFGKEIVYRLLEINQVESRVGF